jgi:hypothetical protein
MVKYECPRCLYNTTNKTNIINHLKRNKICKLSKDGIDIKPSNYSKTIINNEVSMEDFFQLVKNHEELVKKHEELVKKIENLTNPSNMEGNISNIGSNIGNNNSNNINNINININNYKEPNLEYITNEHYKKYMKDINSAYLNMCKEIYFNPKHPENKCISKPNKKDKYIKYFNEGKWNVGNVDNIIPEIIEVLYEAFDKGSMDDRLNDLVYKIDNDEKFKSKIDRDILAECISNS